MLRIGLCPQPSHERQVARNLERIRGCARGARGIHALFFGEAFLQGFDSLAFDPERDIDVAFDENSPALAEAAEIVRYYGVYLGFGYYEKDRGNFYAAYRVLDSQGQVLCHYRRRSPGWRYPDSPACYREGDAFCTFSILGKTFGLMVCGDFFTDSLLPDLKALEASADAFIWPVHCDYPLEQWRGGVEEEYRDHSKTLDKPVLFVNNLHRDEDRAKGGAYCWSKGQAVARLPAGEAGILTVEL